MCVLAQEVGLVPVWAIQSLDNLPKFGNNAAVKKLFFNTTSEVQDNYVNFQKYCQKEKREDVMPRNDWPSIVDTRRTLVPNFRSLKFVYWVMCVGRRVGRPEESTKVFSSLVVQMLTNFGIWRLCKVSQVWLVWYGVKTIEFRLVMFCKTRQRQSRTGCIVECSEGSRGGDKVYELPLKGIHQRIDQVIHWPLVKNACTCCKYTRG